MIIEIIPDRPCTQVLELIKKIIPQIRDHICKNLGNKKDTSTWNDKLIGVAPLNQHQNLRGLKDWMEEKGITFLYSISNWDQNRWIAWRMQALPNRLKNQWEDLKLLLAGIAPINKRSQDSYIWDPSGGNFTLKSSYKFFQNHNNHENWNLWSVVWKNESLPKINFFA